MQAINPAPRAIAILAAERVADSNGSCRADSERHHVRDAHCVQSNLMACQRNRSEASDERSDNREDPDFESKLRRGRQSQSHNFPDSSPVWPGLRRAQAGLVTMFEIDDVSEENSGEVRA